MRPEPFALERYFAEHEFSTKWLLCSSDPETMTTRELLALEPGARERLLDQRLGYTESRGAPDLRALIAGLYEETGAEEILVHAGAEEPIFALLNILLSPGDHVIVQTPCYQSHTSVALAVGAQVSAWVGDESQGWLIDPDELHRLVRPETRVVVTCSPHNPTGHVIDRGRLDAIVSFARERGLWLISDEVYRGLERAPSKTAPAACDLYERAISIGAMAKVYGLAGLRIGWIATRARALYDEVAAFKDYLTICNSAPSELLAEIALRHRGTLVGRTREIIARNLDELDRFFARHPDRFEWRRPDGGTTAFVRLRHGHAARWCRDVVERAGVLLLPSTLFSFGDEHVRLGYGRVNLPEALGALEAAL